MLWGASVIVNMKILKTRKASKNLRMRKWWYTVEHTFRRGSSGWNDQVQLSPKRWGSASEQALEQQIWGVVVGSISNAWTFYLAKGSGWEFPRVKKASQIKGLGVTNAGRARHHGGRWTMSMVRCSKGSESMRWDYLHPFFRSALWKLPFRCFKGPLWVHQLVGKDFIASSYNISKGCSTIGWIIWW